VEEAAVEAAPASDPAGIPGGRETVLVAEDSEAVRDVACELLAAIGYTVLAASRGEEALAIAQSHPGPIDLLLTDVVMPGLGGGSLAQQVRAARPEARVLFMSGCGEGAKAAGRPLAGPLLLKPFGQDRLARAVRECLEGDESGRRGA